MANNFVQTSFKVECSTEDAQKLLDMADERRGLFEAQEIDESLGASFQHDTDGVWIHDDESANVDGLIELLQEWMGEVGGELPIHFEWANTCSKPRLDEFGGGAVVIWPDGEVEWVNTTQWVSERVEEGHSRRASAKGEQKERNRGD